MTDIERPAELAEIFFSYRLPEAEAQTLILSAVGIHSWTLVRGGGYSVCVEPEFAAPALQNLHESALEVAPASLPVRALQRHPHAWLGSICYAVILMGVAYAAGIDLLGRDWLAAGALNGSLPATHEWWRVLTALTLHADVAHLIGNLVFGTVLGYFASRDLGGGIAWAAIVLGAALGNALDAFWMPAANSSIGASTAVFAALGLISGHAWLRDAPPDARRLKRWAPLVGGVMLLGLTGMGGGGNDLGFGALPEVSNVDVVAHVTGFISGCGLGALLGWLGQERFAHGRWQVFAALAGVAALAGAWAWPLLRQGA